MTDFQREKLFSHSALGLIGLFCVALLTTTAGTNVCLFLLLLLTPWAWKNHHWTEDEWRLVRPFFLFVMLFCAWDLFINLLKGHSLLDSLEALRHVRKFFFVLVFWPFFALARHTRVAIWTLFSMVLILSVANLIWSVGLGRDDLMIYSMPNMHGQILVGIALLLAHAAIHNKQHTKLIWCAVVVLLCSLFFGSVRRTGYVLLVFGGLLLLSLSYREQPKPQKIRFLWIGGLAVVGLFSLALLSPKVQHRTWLIYSEFHEFFQLSSYERSQLETSVGLRLQYVVSSLKIIKENLWLGVGSLTFKPLFWEVNQSMGAKNPLIFAPNPHNEYLYILATKGVLGLGFYLGIFVQACRIANKRSQAWQRHGLWIFVCLFLLSILFNSMSIDMVEGHFMMLVFLCFLAPQKIWPTSNVQTKPKAC